MDEQATRPGNPRDFSQHIEELTGVKVENYGLYRYDRPGLAPIHSVNMLGGTAISQEVIEAAYNNLNFPEVPTQTT